MIGLVWTGVEEVEEVEAIQASPGLHGVEKIDRTCSNRHCAGCHPEVKCVNVEMWKCGNV